MIRGPLPERNECQECPLARDGMPTRPVRGAGSSSPTYIIVGESPGLNEERLGAPFLGASGRLLNQAIASTGGKRENIYITNTINCRPPTAGKEAVMKKAVECCRPRLLRELDNLSSAPILALGKHAMEAFLGNEFKITEVAGSYHVVDIPELGTVQVIPTLHPAAILRGGNGEGSADAHATDLLYWNLIYDVGKAQQLADGTLKPFSDDVTYEYRSPAGAERLLETIAREARLSGLVAVDTETIGVLPGECAACPSCEGHSALESVHARLVAIGLATEERAVSVAWAILSQRTKEIVARLLADTKVVKIFQNRGYDTPVLEKHGLPVCGRIEDTMLQHHNAFPGLSHKLQRIATQFFAIGNWKSEFRHGKGSIEELLKYNARDTLVTARLHKELTEAVNRTESTKTYEMDLKMAEIAHKMQVWGIPIDLNVNKQLAEHFLPIIESNKQSLLGKIVDPVVRDRFMAVLATEKAKRVRKKDAADFEARWATRMEEVKEDWDGLNLDAGDQVVALLKACGVQLYSVTKTGKTSTSKDILEKLASTYPIVRELLNYREALKLYGTFVVPVPATVDNTGRTHVVWGVNMITGRWNSKPNYQNQSKGDKARGIPNIRSQVVVPPGRMFVGADFKALEARIVAMLSGCKYLCDAFATGKDVHAEFAGDIFPGFADMEPDKRSRLRDHTKRAEYGYLYRANVMTVWNALTKEGHDVPLKTIERMFRTFKERMPEVERFYDTLFAHVAKYKEVRSFLYGRRRAFPTGQADPTVVCNFPVQSSAADIMDTGLLRFYEAKPDDVYILIQGHDSLTVECDEKNVDETRALMVKCLEQQYEYRGVPMNYPVDCKEGRSWANL